MSESADRKALRKVAELWLDNRIDTASAMRHSACVAREALAKPDPCEGASNSRRTYVCISCGHST